MKCFVIMGAVIGQEDSRESREVFLNKKRAEEHVEKENAENGRYPGNWYLYIEERELLDAEENQIASK